MSIKDIDKLVWPKLDELRRQGRDAVTAGEVYRKLKTRKIDVLAVLGSMLRYREHT